VAPGGDQLPHHRDQHAGHAQPRALAVGPDDAGLAQAVAERTGHRQGLGVEGPAVEVDAREHVLGHRSAPELETAVEVGRRLGQHSATQQHERAADDAPGQRLATAEPRSVGQARADDDVGVLQQREHGRQRRERRRAVGVAVQPQLAVAASMPRRTE
jgi:hypothetical protein